MTVLVQDNGGTANGGVNTSVPQTFNIELVDGLVLASCTDLDTAGATYMLVTDLYTSGSCLSVSANDVTLDGNFHALLGDGVILGSSTANKGIQASSVTGLMVKNMEISYFNVGVNLGKNSNALTGNLLHNNTHSGIFLANNTTTGNFITENDFGGPAAAALPQSCQDIVDANPGATDGDYTISPSGQTFTIYCNDMGGTLKEYLTLVNTGGDFNHGQYSAGGASPGTNVRTNYTKVRFDPATLTVHTGDQTFTSSTGSH